jgi:uncharacterized protein YdcH (DUF465 family)
MNVDRGSLDQNAEYRSLAQQHTEFEERLRVYSEKVVLTDDEQVEEINLKKKKLQLKDRMEAIARQTRESVAHS